MHKLPQHRSCFDLRTLRAGSSVIFVIALAIVCLIIPFRRTNAIGGQSFTPEADTFIDGNQPHKDFGSEPSIIVNSSPPMAGLLRFVVSGTTANTPSRAQLRLFVSDGSNGAAATVYVFRTSAEWDEQHMTWNSQPAFGDQLGSSGVGTLVEGQWVEIDLGPAVSGDGIYSFAITSDTTDQVSFAARTAANPAQLIIGALESTPAPTQTITTPTNVTVTPTDGTITPTDATTTPTDGTTTPTDGTATPTDETTTPTDGTTTATPTATPTDEVLLSSNQNSTQTPTTTVTPNASNTTVTPKLNANYTVYLPLVRHE